MACFAWLLSGAASTEAAIKPAGGSSYQGVLSAHRGGSEVTLHVSQNAKTASAGLKCLSRPRGRAAIRRLQIPPIPKLALRRGRFSGALRLHRRPVWSIAGSFVSREKAVAKVVLPDSCGGGHGKATLRLRPKRGRGALTPPASPGGSSAGGGGSGLGLAPETGRAVSKTIGSEGGTLATTDAAGDALQLTIPEEAVPGEVQITMTPLAGVSGAPLPAGGFRGGVDLKPDGLQLMKTATLTVVPSQPVPAADTTAFTYSGTGQDFHLTLPGSDAGADFAIPVLHFTGYGAWEADQAARNAANSQSASTAEGTAQQEMSEAVGEWRSEEINEQEFEERAAQILQRFYDSGIAPEIPAAMSDDATGEKTIRELLTFERDAQLLGVAGRVHPSEGEIFATAREIVLKMIQRAEADCAQNHHLAQVPRMIRLDREYVLLEGSEIPLETLVRCWKFRLEFDSTIVHPDEGGSFTYEVTASVPLTVDVNTLGLIKGSGPESYAVATGEIPGECPERNPVVLTGTTPGTLSVSSVELGLDAEAAFKEPRQQVANLEITASPGEMPNGPPDETYTGYACEGGTGSASEPLWLTLFELFHESEIAPGPSGTLKLTGFEPQSGATIGRRQYIQSLGEDTENTTITLTHTPPP